MSDGSTFIYRDALRISWMIDGSIMFETLMNGKRDIYFQANLSPPSTKNLNFLRLKKFLEGKSNKCRFLPCDPRLYKSSKLVIKRRSAESFDVVLKSHLQYSDHSHPLTIKRMRTDILGLDSSFFKLMKEIYDVISEAKIVVLGGDPVAGLYSQAI